MRRFALLALTLLSVMCANVGTAAADEDPNIVVRNSTTGQYCGTVTVSGGSASGGCYVQGMTGEIRFKHLIGGAWTNVVTCGVTLNARVGTSGYTALIPSFYAGQSPSCGSIAINSAPWIGYVSGGTGGMSFRVDADVAYSSYMTGDVTGELTLYMKRTYANPHERRWQTGVFSTAVDAIGPNGAGAEIPPLSATSLLDLTRLP